MGVISCIDTFTVARQWCVFAYARTKHIPLEDVSPQQRRNASGIAGGISGATTAALFRASSSIFVKMCLMC